MVRRRLKDLRIYEQELVEDVWTMDYHGLLAVKLKLQRAIATGGEKLAANAMALVRVQDRIARMMGYDKPIQVHNVLEGNLNVSTATHISIDYTRLTAEELAVLERILLGSTEPTAPSQGGESTTKVEGIHQTGVADTQPTNGVRR